MCLRFLPVLDIVIHRFLEALMNSPNKPLESILTHMGCLYKFHGTHTNILFKIIRTPLTNFNHSRPHLDRPITYLYHTLHFYERKLQDRPALKKILVSAIIGSLSEIRPANWALSEQYQKCILKAENDEAPWTPDTSYYFSHVRRIADSTFTENI